MLENITHAVTTVADRDLSCMHVLCVWLRLSETSWAVPVFACVCACPNSVCLAVCLHLRLVLLVLAAAHGLGMRESSGPRSGVQKGVQK